jgi:LPXTG-motif cell wall-anchored protein
MRRTAFSSSLVIVGACLLLAVLSSWSGPGLATVHAQTQPPPRPTLTPAPTPRPSSGNDDSSEAATGRITGTVIDLTTGAPAPGVAVTVGDTTVTTDSNGNYDRSGLAAGEYSLALVLAAGQGAPAQAPIVVTLADDATVIQHLSFRSPAPAASAPAPATPPAALPTTGGPAENGWLVLALSLLMIAGGVALRFRRTA